LIGLHQLIQIHRSEAMINKNYITVVAVIILAFYGCHQNANAHDVCDDKHVSKEIQKPEKSKETGVKSPKKIRQNAYEKKINEGGFDFFNEKPDAETCRWMGGANCDKL